MSVWSGLPWWEQAVEAVPSLAIDLEAGSRALAAERAAEEHVDAWRVRVAAAGKGVKVFHRREHAGSRHTRLGMTGSNFAMKPEPRHPQVSGLHRKVRAGHASRATAK